MVNALIDCLCLLGCVACIGLSMVIIAAVIKSLRK